ncbi:MAG TPA: thioredoxin fold domain-containing protein [Ignavibacteria bacterium]
MKNISKLIFVSLFLFLSSNLFSQVKFETGSFQEMKDKAAKENKIIMVDFFTDWCKWCVELDNFVYTDPQVAGFANNNFISWKIDAEKGEGVELAKTYNIPSYPSIIFMKSDGTEIDRIVGYFPAKKFYGIITDYQKGINTMDYLKTKLKENPNDITSNFKMGEKLVDLENKDEAKPYIAKVIELDNTNSSGYLDAAVLLKAYIDDDTEKLKEFPSLYPNSEKVKDSYLMLGEIYYTKLTDNEKAQKTFDEAFEKFGKEDFEVKYAYGQFILNQVATIVTSKDPSNDALKEALLLSENNIHYVIGTIHEASMYYYQASVYKTFGEKEKANDAIDKALKIHDRKSFRDLKTKINS